MDIMVTMPDDPAERQALLRRAAELHAEAICAVLEGLNCPAAQKTALLQSLIRSNQAEKAGGK